MNSPFYERFAELCREGDNGGISDFVITKNEELYFIKNDEVNKTDILCTPGDFDHFESNVVKNNSPEEGENNYDGSMVFRDWRFRVNCCKTMGKLRAVLRLLPSRIIPIDELGMPNNQIENLTQVRSGLVLVCGVTGSGKSTTIASTIQHLAEKSKHNVITLEDPVEYLFNKEGVSKFTQRQIGEDVPSFGKGLRAALRQKPSIIMVGEIRDGETAEIALHAALSGHIVFSTLHTGRVWEAAERFSEMMPQSTCARSLLSDALQIVICQRLVQTPEGGRTPLFEVYKKHGAGATAIRNGKFLQLKDQVLNGSAEGCLYMKTSLEEARMMDLIADPDLKID